MKKRQPKGTVFTPRRGNLSTVFADSQRVKNVLRNTTGQGSTINLDGSLTIYLR